MPGHEQYIRIRISEALVRKPFVDQLQQAVSVKPDFLENVMTRLQLFMSNHAAYHASDLTPLLFHQNGLGWGVVMGDQAFQGSWTTAQGPCLINIKELLAIQHLVNLSQIHGQAVQLHCDNISAISYLQHWGGTPTAHRDIAMSVW
ncbi:hypothetical protein DM01DRAFT_1373243 [Hesseltinella vesiculosa]|uniref:RNase H type-1 domain-containing protein n=1 Tax=Hesseltinella vesiculosa TaxID=101127 RepID=A0A1X2GLC8_9FUNG|nr:hypothetical protein DM01DRAFT_1373243 [Hesseltinella vesiculosa]